MDAVTNTTTGTPATSSTNTDQARSNLTSDFETFLQMLTTQARYQDPLDPVDSTEFSAQLAQFSMVEQQVQTNELMGQLISALSVSETGNLAGWIGMEALSKAPANFSGAPITVVPDVPTGAEELFLVVRDSNNRVVDTREIPVSDKPYSWDGAGLNGTRLPDGAYVFSVEARARGEVVGTGDVRSYARVTETRIDGDKTMVGFEGGGFVDSSEVSGLRAPQT